MAMGGVGNGLAASNGSNEPMDTGKSGSLVASGGLPVMKSGQRVSNGVVSSTMRSGVLVAKPKGASMGQGHDGVIIGRPSGQSSMASGRKTGTLVAKPGRHGSTPNPGPLNAANAL